MKSHCIQPELFFSELFKVLPSESYYYKDFILLSGRYQRARDDYNKGVLDRKSHNIEINQVINAVLEILKRDDLDLSEPINNKTTSITRTISHFWDPYFENKTTIVIGTYYSEKAKAWEASTLMGTGDALALGIVLAALNQRGIKNYSIVPTYNFTGDRYQDNLILIGGPDTNTITHEFYRKINSRIKFGNPDLHEIPYYDSELKKYYSPVKDKNSNVSRDYGLMFKFPNQYNPESQVMILAGCHGFGTCAAAQVLESDKMIESIESCNYRCGFECFLSAEVKNDWVQKPNILLTSSINLT